MPGLWDYLDGQDRIGGLGAGLLALSQGLLAGGAPSSQPGGLARGLGAGLGGFGQAINQFGQQQVQGRLAGMELGALNNAQAALADPNHAAWAGIPPAQRARIHAAGQLVGPRGFQSMVGTMLGRNASEIVPPGDPRAIQMGMPGGYSIDDRNGIRPLDNGANVGAREAARVREGVTGVAGMGVFDNRSVLGNAPAGGGGAPAYAAPQAVSPQPGTAIPIVPRGTSAPPTAIRPQAAPATGGQTYYSPFDSPEARQAAQATPTAPAYTVIGLTEQQARALPRDRPNYQLLFDEQGAPRPIADAVRLNAAIPSEGPTRQFARENDLPVAAGPAVPGQGRPMPPGAGMPVGMPTVGLAEPVGPLGVLGPAPAIVPPQMAQAAPTPAAAPAQGQFVADPSFVPPPAPAGLRVDTRELVIPGTVDGLPASRNNRTGAITIDQHSPQAIARTTAARQAAEAPFAQRRAQEEAQRRETAPLTVEQRQATEDRLAREILNEPVTRQARSTAAVLNSMYESARHRTRAADLDLVYGLVHILDPNSVVREGEQVTARNTQSIPDEMMGMLNRIIGGEALSGALRNDFLRIARQRAAGINAGYAQLRNHMMATARRRGLDVESVGGESITLPEHRLLTEEEWGGPLTLSATAARISQPGTRTPPPDPEVDAAIRRLIQPILDQPAPLRLQFQNNVQRELERRRLNMPTQPALPTR